MFYLSLVLLSSLPSLTGADLSLEIRLVKKTIMTGEATKLVATWKPRKSIQVVLGAEAVWLDTGAGYERYSEARLGEPVQVTAPTSLSERDTPRTEYQLGVYEVPDSAKWPSMRFAFPTPGHYKVRLTYDGVTSNELALEVVSPAGSDAELLDHRLRKRPELLTPIVNADDAAAALADQCVTAYPTSAYLAPTILLRSERRFAEAAAADISAGRNPWEGAALAVFEELRSRDLTGTAFGEDHLLLIAELTERLFELDRRREAYEDVIERYPDGVAAVKAKEWLTDNVSDRTAPVLNLIVYPGLLWPPTHQFTEIAATLRVSDDRDAKPAVKLLSITCDDSCDPSKDIAEADFGTDDRTFRLRADRTGAGKGRTYTITYEAADAAGNKTTATTMVVVPHDQGKAPR